MIISSKYIPFMIALINSIFFSVPVFLLTHTKLIVFWFIEVVDQTAFVTVTSANVAI